MGQRVIKQFISDGNDINLVLGFIPAKAEIINLTAADTEIWKMEYYNLFGDEKEYWHFMHQNDGGGDVTTPTKRTGNGYVSAYNASSFGGPQRSVTFDDTGGAAEDLISCVNAAHVPINGEKVKFVADGGLPTNLDQLTNYYVIDSEQYGAGTFRISLTKNGPAVDFGSDGTPPNYFINLNRQEPAVDGGMGLTILAGTFMADGSVIIVDAIEADIDKNIGDVSA